MDGNILKSVRVSIRLTDSVFFEHYLVVRKFGKCAVIGEFLIVILPREDHFPGKGKGASKSSV